jgi:hypothetical protein
MVREKKFVFKNEPYEMVRYSFASVKENENDNRTIN